MARRRSSFHVPGVSFSWKRALGVTAAKQKFARATGIPTTRSGRQRKAARMMGCGGCLVQILTVLTVVVVMIIII